MSRTFDYDQITTSRLESWSEFRKYIDGTIAELAYQSDDRGDFYTVVTEPYAGITQQISLQKSPVTDDLNDFIINFRDKPVRRVGTFTGATLVERNNQTISISDSLQTHSLLVQILKELKKMNAHLQYMTGEENIDLDLQ